MNKKGEMSSMSLIIGMFVIAVIGVVLAVAIADIISAQTSSISVQNETLTANITGFQNATDVNTSMIFNLTNAPWESPTVDIYNASNGALMTVGTDYFVDYTTSAINFSNGTYLTWSATNDSNVNYSYFGTNYINDNVSRTFIDLIVLLFVLGLALMVLGKLMGFEIMDFVNNRR